ncbi:hypothetical protein B6N60_05248 [Richelia sinica FACHB-800]|uniref:DUF4114 domain-containing protein n=1 Tax=Richelia sinica FACHB-800 TaxID=1357546 RepID=A0A975TD19_9NOST|nr:DUF4114 domain-containing protein [Richelia sinica]MBD2665523.1 DUF4114 domain-containing protein [Richelia sinica FACHB-800]QXE26515.1 hypothetical protein B6N60_05248 [Richelia sinica FACHB-800]
MTTISNFNNGIFTVGSTGKVSVDFLYDGGLNKGELAIFSLQGMEGLEVGSTAFILEAARRALSNSQNGYVVVRDESDRARFSDLKGELSWEKDFNGGVYKGPQQFQMAAGGTFAMMLISDSTVASIAQSSTINTDKVQFSFGRVNPTTGTVSPQIADITGKGNTFGWEDINTLKSSDRDFNDMVVQVSGATATAPTLQDSVYSNRNWLNTQVGQELTQYTNRPRFESGTFIVDGTGQVKFDYLSDGGWYQGQMGMFSLKGMETYQQGSLEFIREATRRALSNSTEGRLLMSDSTEGARFNGNVSWEPNFNAGNYQGIKSFQMNAGDEVAFILVQNTTLEEIYRQPYATAQAGKQVILSTDQNQIVAVDKNGTLAFEDISVSSGFADKDFNDIVFQVQGLSGNNIATMDAQVNPNRDWRITSTGQDLLNYANRSTYTEGVFSVGETGKVTFDFLYDGGWYQGEFAVFSLQGMDNYQPGSEAFIKEAARRALSNTTLGYVLANDPTEAARFTEKMPWEPNFNSGSYLGVKTFEMNPGDKFAVMFVPNTTVADISKAKGINSSSSMWQYGKLPLFSIPQANPSTARGQIVNVDGNGTFAFEDIPTGSSSSDRDYNDFIFQFKGAKGTAQSMDNFSNSDRNWRTTNVGQQLLEYSNRATFDEGVFVVNKSGQVTIDFLYDGGEYKQGEVGIFSLKGMDMYETGSAAFIQEAVRRATSNSKNGYVVVQDANDGGLYSDNTGILNWEPNFNGGVYQGEKIYEMNAGDAFGFVLAPNGTLNEILSGASLSNSHKPVFSMSAANLNDTIQVAEVLTGSNKTMIGFEDVTLNSSSDRDYNDFVLSLKGVQSIGITDIKDVMVHYHNWVDTSIGADLTNYFNTGVI